MNTFWKEDWEQAKENLIKWWHREGPAFSIMAPKDEPWEDLPPPEYYLPFCQPNAPRPKDLPGGDRVVPEPENLETVWTGPDLRFRAAEYHMAHTFYGGEAFPYFDIHLGPGNLATFVGSEPEFTHDTVWYRPCMSELEGAPPIVFDENNPWWQKQKAIIEYGVAHAEGRFLVSMPDLIENVDILASLRGTTEILMDMVLHPDEVKRRIAQLNAVYFEAFDRLYNLVRDEENGNCFSFFDIWAPGKTIKTQCDLAATFSPKMFEEIVLPGLAEQCAKLDYVMYHLDGTQALVHLDHILSLEGLRAIEWTPEPGMPGGGSPQWYDLYKKILNAGVSVQVVGIKTEEIVPLLEAVGSEGMFLQIRVGSETEARRLLDKLEQWRK